MSIGKTIRIEDGKEFEAKKIIVSDEGQISVWCNDWDGQHIEGVDCYLKHEPTHFGRWLLKNATIDYDASGSLYWVYCGEGYNTDELFNIFEDGE